MCVYPNRLSSPDVFLRLVIYVHASHRCILLVKLCDDEFYCIDVL